MRDFVSAVPEPICRGDSENKISDLTKIIWSPLVIFLYSPSQSRSNILRREVRASRQLYGGGGSCSRDLHMDTRRLKCVLFGKLVGAAGCVRGQEKELMGCFLDDLRAIGINADQWTTVTQTEGEWRRTVDQGANILWQNWSLQRKPRLDYGMQWYARTPRGGPRRG